MKKTPFLSATFCCGVFASMAQVLFVRETLVVFHGSELSIGAVMASWLAGVAVGAAVARFLAVRVSVGRLAWWPSGLLAVGGLVAPLQILGIRVARSIAGVPQAEYGSLGYALACSLLLFAPTAVIVGIFFPTACILASKNEIKEGGGRIGALSRVYAAESVGSMVGGVVLTWVALPLLDNIRAGWLACCFAFAGSFLCVQGHESAKMFFRAVIGAAAMLYGVAAWHPSLRHEIAVLRWRSVGILPSHGVEEGGAELVADIDTPYQNLALVRISGQHALYANGILAGIFPDPIGTEHNIHFIMAQKPLSRRVLVIGGIPTEDIPEILRYPVEEVVYVELDPAMGSILEKSVKDSYAAVFGSGRVRVVHDDAVRYVRRCKQQFDMVMVNAGEPVTLAAGRWVTHEFFSDIRKLLNDEGVMVVSMTSSERLQAEAAAAGGSIYSTLKSVFPVVLVTAETRNRYFAGFAESDLTFDRDELFQRSSSAHLGTRYFRPEYFLFADEIDPPKTALVTNRFASACSQINTILWPSASGYAMALWSRFSGSGIEGLVAGTKRWSVHRLSLAVAVVGIALLMMGLALRVADGIGRERLRVEWRRLMIVAAIGAGGFWGMALDMALILLFQSFLGCIYTKMGFVNAVFMSGLALGALSGRRLANRGEMSAWYAFMGIQACLAAFAVTIPPAVRLALGSVPGIELSGFGIYVAVGVTGWGVGALFALGNWLLIQGGVPIGAAASVTELLDHLGAASGALALGALFFPALGVSGSCVLIAAIAAGGLLASISACVAHARSEG